MHKVAVVVVTLGTYLTRYHAQSHAQAKDMSYQCELWHRSLLGKEEATEAHVFLDPVEREVHSTICLCTRHQYEYDDEPNTYYYIMPLNIAYLKRSSKGEWVLLLWAHQPAPCTNQSRHLKWRRSLQVFQRNNGAQQLLNTLRGHLQTMICTLNVIVTLRGWGVLAMTLIISFLCNRMGMRQKTN